ncbi:MAG: DUF2283 domain-containing protein [Dehalococcoidales bacterium]|nr:DUF2283 domain-containing protein [Dehalococcoidales bacterium]
MKDFYDKKADAIYIELSDKPYAMTKELDETRYIDFADDNTIIGVELLCVSEGVTTGELPERRIIEQVLEKHGIKICV